MIPWLVPIADAAWRVVLLIALGLAPYAAPVEAVGARGPLVACVRLSIFLVLVFGVLLAVRRSAARYPVFAFITASSMLALPIASAALEGDRGPLGRGAWLAAALVWSVLAAAIAGPLGPSWSRRARRGMAGAVLAAGALGLVVAAHRLRPREHLWQLALDTNPGDEAAALVLARRSLEAGMPERAYAVLASCASLNEASCPCAEGAAETALDLSRYTDAKAVLDRTLACPRSPRRIGLTAEALVGTGSAADGMREAEVDRDGRDPHAAFARAWGTMILGLPDARARARDAVDRGRGLPAHLLLGLIAFRENDIDAAASEFQAVLDIDPKNPQATYDLALVAQRRGRYNEAREGYLRALAIDPRLADARYNLAILTHDRGVAAEARHHAEVFAASYPGDPRASALRALVDAPPSR